MMIGIDMKYNYLLLALATAALFSCSRNEVEDPDAGGVHVTIHAYQEGAIDTRTTLVDGGTQVYWEPSDEIKVFFRGSGSRFISQNTQDATVTDFTGTLNVVVGLNEGASGSNTLWGLYPYRADATSDGASVTTTLPAEQAGRAGSFAKGTNITLAQSTSFDLAFYNVCGGIRFSLTQEGVKEVVFEGQNNESIAGKVKIAFADGVPTIQEVVEGQKTITLSAPNGGTFETGKWYYIVALSGTLSNGFKMTFNKDSQYATLKSSGSKTIKRGIFGSLADADEDLIYKDKEGGDTPNPDDVIQFEDPVAKYACVDKFDINKDGEVSYEEAAAVTSLSGLFTDWNTVTSFEEIRYFTLVTSTQNVFNGLTKLTHITIPNNITTLGTFSGCTALETVVLPATLNALPNNCFDGCSSLKTVTLPTGITSIPNYAFRNCTALETLSVPSTTKSVGQYAFSGCIVLTGIDLPLGLQTIGNYAFQNCQAISSIDFPASLTSIGQYAYSGCISLTSIAIEDSATVGAYAFKSCSAMTAARIGTNVSLGSSAFSNCTALTSVIMSHGVSVGQSAFSGCTSLISVVLPEDMTSIPASCFQNCPRLTTITWPVALSTIEDYAFAGCRFEGSEYTLFLPSSISVIGDGAFVGLRHLVLPSTSAIAISSSSFGVGYPLLYVPANLVEIYRVRTNWSVYADRIHSIDDYPILRPITPIGVVGEAVDLGLSVKWASWNLGASAPEEFGSYYAWGEIETKSVYDENTYLWGFGFITMYNTESQYGIVDNKTTLELIDDAAHVNWGGSWRMPTQTEVNELYDNCTRVLTTQNGVYGCRFISKKSGYTDKSIFLPAAGSRYDDLLYGEGSEGTYWASTLHGHPRSGCNIYFSGGVWLDGSACYRFGGHSIRPVCD